MSRVTSRADCSGIALMPAVAPTAYSKFRNWNTARAVLTRPRRDPMPITRAINLPSYYIAVHQKFYDRDKPLAHPARIPDSCRANTVKKIRRTKPRTNINRAIWSGSENPALVFVCFNFQRLTVCKINIALMYNTWIFFRNIIRYFSTSALQFIIIMLLLLITLISSFF